MNDTDDTLKVRIILNANFGGGAEVAEIVDTEMTEDEWYSLDAAAQQREIQGHIDNMIANYVSVDWQPGSW